MASKILAAFGAEAARNVRQFSSKSSGEIVKNVAQNMTVRIKFSAEDRELHNQFSEYGRNAKEWMRKCALLLPEIERRQIWKKKGFSCLYEYAAKLAGMSRNTVDDALRILRKIEDKPALQKVVEWRGLNAVRPVAAIATVETEKFWAEKAGAMSKNTLEIYVREYKKAQGGEPETDRGRAGRECADTSAAKVWQQFGGIGYDEPNRLNFGSDSRTSTAAPSENDAGTREVTMKLNQKIAVELEKLNGNGDWNELMQEFLELRKQKLEAEKPEPVETESRHVPEKIKQFVLARTRGQCAFPACTKPYAILHHIQRWALKNIHDPDQLVPLCTSHERIAHNGLIENEEKSPDEWCVMQEPIWWEFKNTVDRTVMEHRKV